jgi:hypothetical protein
VAYGEKDQGIEEGCWQDADDDVRLLQAGRKFNKIEMRTWSA